MSIKQLARELLRNGMAQHVSDVYILPFGTTYYQLSFRRHDQITDQRRLTFEEGERLILYFKYLGGMDVSEKRKVQVGSGVIRLSQRKVCRIRLSTVANFMNLETLVIRLLYDASETDNISHVLPEQWETLKSMTRETGLYLFSGPTGAGKSTTMYLLAKYLQQTHGKQVITIEDPVEITDTSFLQCQINEAIQLTYDELIKVCLRHRPDLLIVGEIRDQLTATMAIRAALTGHLVFSSIHARSKQSVRQRLLDLGVAEPELNECLEGVIYQRLLPCVSGHYGVLYDMTLSGKDVSTWEKSLQKSWQNGTITEKIKSRYL
ncbi:hypothetical protein CBF34_10830 [Vagococcus penaei]|uniref:Uncharacterized protein n=1 Tax=Vagococcus penaei TaxID=633807 RepID=A0A1Q2D5L7_9ENTE|nr:competence type IV pilus ATPase ComGA [Vagococcus penaei]AQP53690.1 hypothetical protein BW732_05185 [Vagococcus penaei]RST97707.1 hypothetical protein CBF34_10830 [Vagococcus penaei]